MLATNNTWMHSELSLSWAWQCHSSLLRDMPSGTSDSHEHLYEQSTGMLLAFLMMTESLHSCGGPLACTCAVQPAPSDCHSIWPFTVGELQANSVTQHDELLEKTVLGHASQLPWPLLHLRRPCPTCQQLRRGARPSQIQ